jgi:putative peptide zinc metalloprotease protein
LVEVPNLHQKSTNQLKYFCKRYLFGLRQAVSPSDSKSGAFWLSAFALASQIYRLVVFSGIVLFVADRFLLLGVIMAVLCISGWIVVPLVKFVHYLAASPELTRQRRRAVTVTAVLVFGVLSFLQFVPFPHYFKAPGIFESQTRTQVLSETPGTVAEIVASDGQTVRAGDPLLRLENPDIDLALRLSEARIREQDAKLRLAMRTENADLRPIRLKLAAERARLAKLKVDRENLIVRASVDGKFVAPALKQSLGPYFEKGSSFGLIVDPENFEFTATVRQEDADRLFTRTIETAEVRIPGQSGERVVVENLLKIPSDQNVLPSAALGWTGGGDIQTNPRDPDGRVTKEPFFSVRADIRDAGGATLLHGRSAKIRFAIGKTPLLPRWIRSFRQLLQRRFQV